MSLIEKHIFRIDDRLVHGQVIVGWIKKYSFDSLIIINTRVASDEFQQNILKAVVPDEVSLYIFSIGEAERVVKEGLLPDDKKVMILTESLADAASVLPALPLKKLFIGGLHFQPGKEKVLPNFAINAAEKALIGELLERGVSLYFQSLPGSRQIDLKEIL